jgi:hypothetical protein
MCFHLYNRNDENATMRKCEYTMQKKKENSTVLKSETTKRQQSLPCFALSRFCRCNARPRRFSFLCCFVAILLLPFCDFHREGKTYWVSHFSFFRVFAFLNFTRISTRTAWRNWATTINLFSKYISIVYGWNTLR